MSTAPSAPANVIPTGSLALDRALGTGGWPRGRIVEIYGPEGGGKTTLALHAIAQAQRTGTGALIDADHATDRDAVRRLGVDPHGLVWHRGNVLEEIAKSVEQFVDRGVDVIVIDSLAALMLKGRSAPDDFPQVKDEAHQRATEHWLKTLLAPLAKSKSVLLVLNQTREKVGVMYGTPEMTPWETHPLKDFASVRVELRRLAHIKERDETIGSEVRAKVVKNRLAPPHRTTDLEIYFDRGIGIENDLFNLGLDADVLTRSTGAVRFGGEVIGRAREDVVRRLRRDAALAGRLHEAVLAGFAAVPVPPPDEDEA
jgi:recombination protein RecA